MSFKEFLDDSYIEDYFVYITEDLDILEERAERRSNADRMKVRAKKKAIEQATGGNFSNWNSIRKAKWLASHKVVYIGGETARIVKREPSLDWKKIYHRLEANARRFKRQSSRLHTLGGKTGKNVQG